MHITSGQPLTEPPAERDRWHVLGILTLVYALNIADRYSISTLLEPIRLELALSDGGVAFLTGVALALFYVTLGIPIATYADRSNRTALVSISLLVWSAMTALCGLAQNYWHLLLARIGVGIGEAGGTPPSTSILADKFAPSRRPMALTVFALGAPLGAWLGSSVAGGVADHYGWRAAFLALGIPGVLVAAILWLTVREPKRGRMDATASGNQGAGFGATLRYTRGQRSAVHLVMGGTVATFWSWGLMWWTPTFLVRSHGLTVGEAGGLLGPIHLVAGIGGTLLAAWFVARKVAGDPRHVAWLLAAVTALSTVPSIFVYVAVSIELATVLLWFFVPAIYFFIGPTLGLLQNVIPAGMRAQTIAILLFTANIANLVLAPQLVGWMSDGFAGSFGLGQESLRWSLVVIAPTGIWGAWHFWRAGRTIREDQARASGVVTADAAVEPVPAMR